MKCPFCSDPNTKVIETRLLADGTAMRRRRECEGCKRRFTTYERIEEKPMYVLKKNGSIEEFEKEKVLRGILRAVKKRNVKKELIDSAVNEICEEIKNSNKSEVTTHKIGEFIMKKLRDLDEVAYVRFASVYKEFNDLESFLKEIEKIKK